ncbi:leishmanolysin-like protein, putative [Bodo saltans]|uniref:Leishmanolysin-like protein, putative n=1 Tax=Bodo saltans TaxID=75058 RepID=A0A0S4JC66_BODSA|nr:leishmanolysin-like protein, putative [Bodo saltans]|eukprot:CUG87954.1 leishmanolysin-like protein, putative [Bodo saltans]
MAPKGFRGSRSVVTLCFAVIGIVLYTILVANVTKMYHRSRSAAAARPGGAPDAQGAVREDNNAARAREVRITEDEPASISDFASWSSSSSNSSSMLKCPHRGGTKSGMECSGHGICNASTMSCACRSGYSGAACDIDLRTAHDVLEYFQKTKLREDAAALSGSESLPRSNALLQRKHVSQLLTVVVPLTKLETSDQAGLQSQWRKQLVKSIKEFYPGITVVEQPAGDVGSGGIVSAWNDAVRIVKTPWTLLLSPATIAIHDQTNLELMLTLLLSSDIDVLGFSTLTPATSESTGELLQPTQKGSDKSGQKKSSAATPSGREEFVYHIDCWNFHGPERWTLSHEKPLFGYHRHAASYAVICDRSSESIIIRTPWSDGTPSLFNASMDVSALTDFYLRTKRSGGVVGTCVECLLKTRLESPFESANSRGANKRSNKDGFDVWGTYVLPSAWRTTSVLSSAFAERYQVEAVVGPHRLDVALHKKFQIIPISTLETAFDTIAATGRIRCTKSGGIYGHSKNGLYSPLCHRYQRQRDFLYLSSLWVNGWGEGTASSSSPRSSKYGVSLHHGNLFGALRFGAELLWETDGDFDFVSFDDSHDAMMQRWQSFISYVTTHAGFETKVPYPEKPWYVNFLRDKTDFQLNVRGIHSEFTRGRPPHIHNISVYYQGYRTYMNGFQNPWQGIRADPGHDYRRRYLTQQGWVLAFTKKAISCKVEGHPSCLPPCGDPAFQSRHQFCDESWLLKVDAAIGDGPRPLDVHPTHLRDPILFV